MAEENTAPQGDDLNKEDDSLEQDFNQKCRDLVEEKRLQMGRELDEALSSHMHEVQHRYNDQKRNSVVLLQTDILRMNKIFRDIARLLGTNWRPVFNYLMTHQELTEAEIELEIKKIEKQKPFMQAYKALLTWKELNDDGFDMLQLVEALKTSDQYDLAEKTLDILDSEGDTLMTLDQVGKGIASGRTRTTNGTDSAATADADASGEASQPEAKKPAAAPKPDTSLDGGLGDRNVLQLAKKIGDDWFGVGEALGLSQETLDEIVAGEGHSYQGGFKMLWNWRDTLNEMEEEQNLQTLKRALEKVGKKDLYAAVFDSK